MQVQYEAYYACSSLLEVFFLMLVGVIFAILTKCSCGVSLLKAVCYSPNHRFFSCRVSNNNNNNDRLTAFDPGQPG